MKSFVSRYFIDFVYLLILGIASYFLIGFFLGPQFLATGYQDWLFHAYRVKSLLQYGWVSWDHSGDNGLNFWLAYQFIPHYLTIFVGWLTGASITQSMLILTVSVFIVLRLFIYLILRSFHIRPFNAFLATFITFSFAHQWNAISDFSLFIMCLFVPLLVYLFILASESNKYNFLFAAVCGLSFIFHPIVGYSATFLFVTHLFFNQKQLDRRAIVISIFVFIIGFSYFFGALYFTGYSIANPIFSSSRFWLSTINSPYFGLSLIYLILLGASWILTGLRAHFVPRWAKILLFYCSVYLLFSWLILTEKGFDALGWLQLSRAITVIGFILPFAFAGVFQGILIKVKSRFVYTLIVIFLAISYTSAISIGSQFASQPVYSVDNVVSRHLKNVSPEGSIYTDALTESNYFGNSSLRYINSYNEHKEPHPLGQRFRNLMRTDSSYTGVTQRQSDLVEKYSNVLGVQYLFLPELSPLISTLTASESAEPAFTVVATDTVPQGVYSILKSTRTINYAYVGEREVMDAYVGFNNLPEPTLFADSYRQWDDAVSKVNDLVETGLIQPVPLKFMYSDTLSIDMSQAKNYSDPVLLLIPSYDQNWSEITGVPVTITPTSTRFMYVTFPNKTLPQAIILKNDWPWWHWALLFVAVANVLAAFGVVVVQRFRDRRVA